ncbi:MAG TPA: 3-deoxy-manno-octulosonate cytidylyltransferase, partial [Flavobacteriales bacterium]|nr:3-deoxy-manno-octulosonate cytidylyltransferase [Flavobacteriales bacterium]
RFPGKPLVDIGGKPMIQRVYEQAKKANGISNVIVATDDVAIEEAVQEFRGNVIMTSADHQSGTDRCAEALKKSGIAYDAVINVQGDEPFIHPEQIEQVARLLLHGNTQIASLARLIKNPVDVPDPSKVKVVFDANQRALYFSRSTIPFNRSGVNPVDYYLHVGIYGYRSNILNEITVLPQSKLERAESLEQLRWMENGYTIHVDITTHESYGIDTKEDLDKIKHLL